MGRDRETTREAAGRQRGTARRNEEAGGKVTGTQSDKGTKR
jgi:hypothetical protein